MSLRNRSILEPSHIFASLKPEKCDQNKKNVEFPRHHSREVQVTGSAEYMVAPNVAVLTIVVTSKKGNAEEAKNSVVRRLEYVEQTLRNHGVQDGDIIIVKNLSRLPNKSIYLMEAQIDATFRGNIHKCMQLHNLFVEKLDETVQVLKPQLLHDKQKLESVRKQTCLSAIANARQKAIEVCRMLGQNLGRPISVKEEHVQEEEGVSNSQPPTNDDCINALNERHGNGIDIQQRIATNTITIRVQVTAAFELKAKTKK